MKILFVASEVAPFAKTGGLADVAAALPLALHKIGHDVRLVMPSYGFIDQKQTFTLPIDFIKNKSFAKREQLYGQGPQDYPDNAQAFFSFCEGALELIKKDKWQPNIIHANDWQTGPLMYLVKKFREQGDFVFKKTATVYSIHNMAYQGYFGDESFALVDELSFARAGLVNADVLGTVSEQYAREIQTKEYGAGLEKLMRGRAGDLYGIVNGLDYEIWNPAKDKNIFKRYSPATLSLKVKNKLALQKQEKIGEGERIPLIGLVSRLDAQKGFDILFEVIEEILALGCQLVILGTGDPEYHLKLRKMKGIYPNQIALKLAFDNQLAHQIYAASDMFLMPSKYEPCGLGQLISFKYGTIPIVRETGGLADTVSSSDGFLFTDYSDTALLQTVKMAVNAYNNDQAGWKQRQLRGMGYDFSWQTSAKKYVSLYMKALKKIGLETL